jgi:pteridine reductase
MDLTDRVAWITGGARRLGREMALALASRGAHVVVHYRRSAEPAGALAADIEALGRRALLVQADLAKPDEIAAAADRIDQAFGRLDVLVNNASNFLRQPIDRVTEADWDRSLSVNLKGAFFCAQAAARLMRRRSPDPVRSGPLGKIVNVADSAALRPYPNHLPYMVSKAGVIAMTQAMALELAPDILVNAIAPGVVLPPEEMNDAERRRALEPLPLGRFGAPDDVVAALRFLLEHGDYVTGQTIVVDGGRAIAQPRRR